MNILGLESLSRSLLIIRPNSTKIKQEFNNFHDLEHIFSIRKCQFVLYTIICIPRYLCRLFSGPQHHRERFHFTATLFNFKIIPDHTSLNQLWTYIVTLTLTVVSLVIISINDVGVSWWTRTVKLLGIRNFAAYVAVKKDHQTVIIKSNLEIC